MINLKKIETDFYCDFGKLVDLTGFQSSILLFVTIDKMCWRHEVLILSFKRNFSHSVTVRPGPGPGSAVGENGKKRGQIGKISAKEASRGVTWGGGKGGATLSPPQTASQLASLADFFLLFPHGGAWSQVILASINKMTSPIVTLLLKIDIEK